MRKAACAARAPSSAAVERPWSALRTSRARTWTTSESTAWKSSGSRRNVTWISNFAKEAVGGPAARMEPHSLSNQGTRPGPAGLERVLQCGGADTRFYSKEPRKARRLRYLILRQSLYGHFYN